MRTGHQHNEKEREVMPAENLVIIMGNVTRDPQLRYTPGGTGVADLGIAINRKWKDDSGQQKEDTTFVDITFWGARAEALSQYVSKGDPLYIRGRLQLDQWDDKDTGQSRSKLKVVGESFEFLKPAGNSGQSKGGSIDPGQGQRQSPPDQY